MKPQTRTTRFLFVMLLAASLAITGSVSMPAMSAMAGVTGQPHRDCCQVATGGNCCGMACCNAPARTPEKPQPDRSQHRTSDWTINFLGVALHQPVYADAHRWPAFSAAVPASGSPTLITQHIRLQL